MPSQFGQTGADIEHDLLRPSIDCKCPHIAIDSVHDLPLDIRRPAKDLRSFAGHEFQGLCGLHFEERNVGRNRFISLPQWVPLQCKSHSFHETERAHDLPSHLSNLVPDHLVGNQCFSERLPFFLRISPIPAARPSLTAPPGTRCQTSPD